MQNNRPCVLTDERFQKMPAAFLSADKPRGGTNAVPYFFRRRRNKSDAARNLGAGRGKRGIYQQRTPFRRHERCLLCRLDAVSAELRPQAGQFRLRRRPFFFRAVRPAEKTIFRSAQRVTGNQLHAEAVF